MNTNFSTQGFLKALTGRAADQGVSLSEEDLREAAGIVGSTLDLVHGLGNYDTSFESLTCGKSAPPKINAGVNFLGDGEKITQLKEYVGKFKDLSSSAKQTLMAEIARTLSDAAPTISDAMQPLSMDYAGAGGRMDGVISQEDLVGRRALGTVSEGTTLSSESYGSNIDNIAANNALNVVLLVLRARTSVIDRAFARVPADNVAVTIDIDTAEFNDLAAMQDPDARKRNAASNRIQLVELMKDPTPISSALQRITPIVTNDQDGCVSTKYANAYVADSNPNVFNLAINSKVFGRTGYNHTDLVAEGGTIDYVYVTLTDGTTSADVKVPTRFIPTAGFGMSNSNDDSADRVVTMNAPLFITPATLDASGATSTLWTGFVKNAISMTVSFSGQLNLRTGELSGGGNAKLALVADASGNTDATLTTALSKLSAKVTAYEPGLYWSEENLRQTTKMLRTIRSQKTFYIPPSCNYITDFSLQQGDDQTVVATTNAVVGLGSTIRSLTILETRLNDIADARADLAVFPEGSNLINPTRMSFVSSQVLPYVYRANLNFSDLKTANLKQSELLADVNSRWEQSALVNLAMLASETLYPNALDPEEVTVYKLFAYAADADVLLNIRQYHAALDDSVETGTGADFSIKLPNNARIDVIKVYYTSFKGKMLIVPVRDNAPDSLLSCATMRDRGTFSGQFNQNLDGATWRRVFTSPRDILFVHDPIGVIFQISHLDVLYGAVTSAAFAADSTADLSVATDTSTTGG